MIVQSHDTAAHAAANAQALLDATRFASLLPAHGLPSATIDPTCCALLAQACARNVKPPQQEVAITDAAAIPDGSGGEGKAGLSPESTRGLLAITAELRRILSADTDTPAEHVGDPRVGKGDHAPSIYTRRESGFTQTPLAESKWITDALQDIVQALNAIGSKSAEGFSSLLARRLGNT